jgi:hypothetical protein
MGRTTKTPKKNNSLKRKIASAKRKYSSSQVKLGHKVHYFNNPNYRLVGHKRRIPKGTTSVDRQLRALNLNASKLHARLNPSSVDQRYFPAGRRVRADFRMQQAINPTLSDTDQPVIAVLGRAKRGSRRNPITIS